jgi:Ferredoxin-like domain in Api92-like protein
MPNYCFNSLDISGTKSDILSFIEQNKQGEQYLDFNGAIPMPEDLVHTKAPNLDTESDKSKELIAKYGTNNWYDWAVNNWGTKWNATCIEDWYVSEDETTAQINFDTAWCQPTEWLIKTSKKYPNIEFGLEFYEEGNCFIGYYKIINGQFLVKNEPEWDSEEGIGLRKDAGIYNEEELEEEDSE